MCTVSSPALDPDRGGLDPGPIALESSAEASSSADERSAFRRLETTLAALVHELEQTRQALELANAALRRRHELFAALSHELRTPLNATLGWAQLLLAGGQDPETLALGLQAIERNARREARLLEDVLALSGLESGTLASERSAVLIDGAVLGAVEGARSVAYERGVVLEARVERGGARVLGDAAGLEQLVRSLLTAAVGLASRGARAEIGLEVRGRCARVVIRDEAGDFSTRLWRHLRDGQRVGGRVGIGLALARRLVDLYGGRLELEGEGDASPLCLVVTLPLLDVLAPVAEVAAPGGEVAAPVAEVAAPTAESEPDVRATRGWTASVAPSIDTPALFGLHVLLVDDEVDAREVLTMMLTHFGAHVRAAGSAEEALGLFRKCPPDVLVSDIAMPVQDGHALVRRIRALPTARGGAVPAIAVTAYATPQDRERALAAGFQAHLSKPVDVHALVRAVTALRTRS